MWVVEWRWTAWCRLNRCERLVPGYVDAAFRNQILRQNPYLQGLLAMTGHPHQQHEPTSPSKGNENDKHLALLHQMVRA